jgi:hypothetical protein
MTFLLMAALQTVNPAMSERIDLTIPQPCASPNASDGEVVVCANPNGESPYRLNQPEQPARKAIPSAQAQVAKGVSVAAETERADIGGFASNRAMVRLKIKF